MKRISGRIAFSWLGRIAVSGILIFNSDRVLSQIVPDNTLGNESSVVNTRDATSDKIDGGAIRGQNLFHSFQEFNVDAGRGVYFANPDAVTNIFSRVTGNNVSNILGTLGVDGAANLFLINPNGIIFGEGASLDVQGSFAATTADGIEFGEQGNFSADNPESPGLLTINPSAYLFNQIAPGAISNNSIANNNIGLQIQPGNNISLIGGNVSFNGGNITAPAGNVQLGGLAALGKVSINNNGSLTFPEGVARGDVFLTQEAFVDVSGTEGGNITVNASNLKISGSSELQTGTFFETGLPGGQSGDIILNATGAVEIDASTLDAGVEIGNAGDIEINATNFSLTNGGEITNSTFGKGNAGNITIDVSNNVRLSNADIFSNVNAGAEGKGGQITIDTGNLYLNTSAQIQTIVRQADRENNLAGGVGDAGNIVVNARGNVAIDGVSNDDNQFPSGLRSTVGNGAEGNGGNIEINATNFFLTNGGEITNSTFGKGNAGNITIDATENVFLDTGGIFSNVGSKNVSQAEGDAGDITIAAKFISLTNGAQIQSGVFESNQGNGSNVTLNGGDNVTISSSDRGTSGIFTDIEKDVVGNGGNIEITSQGSIFLNDASLNSKNAGTGFAGDINLNAKNKLTITNDSVILSDGFFGRIFLNSSNDSINIKDSFIFNDSENYIQDPERFGKIQITSTQGSIGIDNSSITTENTGTGYSGDIKLNAPNEISIKNSRISAEGNFGRIFIGDSITPSQVKLEGTRTGTEDNPEFSNRLSTTNSNADDLAGSITINARNNINVIGSEIESRTETTKTTDINDQDGFNFSKITFKVAEDNLIGTITINQSQISTTNSDIGFSGDVRLNAREKIEILDTSIFSRGKLGRILIGKSDISGETLSPQEIVFNNSLLTVSNASVTTTPKTEINAGEISIDAVNNISFVNDSQINTFTERRGNAGNLTVQSQNGVVSFDNSYVFSNVNAGGIGDAGDVNITADSIFLTNGAQLQSGVKQTFDDFIQSGILGTGGDITLYAKKNIDLSGNSPNNKPSGIFTDVESIGIAGNINITTDSLFLTDKAILTSRSLGLGYAGNITVNANSINLDNNSKIEALNIPSTDISTSLSGGNINLQISNNLILRNSDISTQASSNANGGNINITADAVIAFDDSDIFSFAEGGRGGNIILDTPAYFGSSFNSNSSKIKPNSANNFFNNNDRADLNATGAVSGVVTIPDVSFIENSLADLPDNSLNTENLIANSCVVPSRKQEGKFIITGTGGLPATPEDAGNSNFPTGEVRGIETNDRSWQPGDPIVEPTGLYQLENGETILSRECSP
ncbi:filamentous hemagglutinin family outer membrane protein [Stanieria cyanosphaera PCC 7437]|uniref:Filamentous hemagglutinin family outer membrane protein n=1 Tax=Stanieria cyanosphaera (strain ATCC 29371 / PCC 7437) TaxID=111780 RepID=K9Y1R0_STAC7|nr:filamentous hemagglutinin N-terminal domain-containing protein [Stanieria cyanosphaera]AFZ37927.1 filamentous hemagglutinin family outer membrane protein [Stanieria cyanosphaera PCC 7437]